MKRPKTEAYALRSSLIVRSLGLAVVVCVGQSLVGGSGIAAAQTGMAQTGIGSGISSGGSHQSTTNGTASNGSPSLLDVGPSPFPDNSRQKRNEDRQRRLVGDTQKLVALTAQLKAEVSASGAEAMTPEMLKQMDEIEKLAKSVKDKMRD